MTQANNVAIESSQINSSGVLQPAGGGTGVTSSTGSGSNVLNTSPTLVTPTLGAASASSLALGSALTVANGGTGLTSVGTSGYYLQSSGSGLQYTAVSAGLPGVLGQAFTSNGTFTIPAGVTALKITVIGGGGGGGSTSGSPIGGSASGGAAISYLTGLTPGGTLAVTVGAGGTGGGSYNTGGTGGTSSVASGTQTISTISATGGQSARGSNQGAWIPATVTGIGSGGTINIAGSYGTSALGDFGQGFYWGGTGGDSILGGGGLGNNNGVGFAGGNYGGGAGGSATGAYVGASGAGGIVIFEW